MKKNIWGTLSISYLVRVDRDTEEPGVGVDELVHVANSQVPQDRGVVEVGQVGHVLAAVELRGVDLADQVLLEHLLLPALDGHGHLLSLGVLDEPLAEPTGCLVGHPARLLRVIGLRLGIDDFKERDGEHEKERWR